VATAATSFSSFAHASSLPPSFVGSGFVVLVVVVLVVVVLVVMHLVLMDWLVHGDSSRFAALLYVLAITIYRDRSHRKSGPSP
jgi:hypothetical protein